jgi:hypothetical protein
MTPRPARIGLSGVLGVVAAAGVYDGIAWAACAGAADFTPGRGCWA